MKQDHPVPGKDGNLYVPYEDRTGESSVVFFTRDLSEAGLKKIYDRVGSVLSGRVAVKLHTGEAEGPNIIPRPWVKELLADRLPDATIIETNNLQIWKQELNLKSVLRNRKTKNSTSANSSSLFGASVGGWWHPLS